MIANNIENNRKTSDIPPHLARERIPSVLFGIQGRRGERADKFFLRHNGKLIAEGYENSLNGSFN